MARASVYLCCSAAVLSCALVCSFLTSCPLKMCRLARRPNRGDSKHRTRPGEHRRRTNLRNCQHPSVLVSCGCAADVCDLCLVTFWDNRAFTADHQRESARCVSNTRRGIVEAVADPQRECAMDKTTPMKLSSLQVQHSRGLQLRLHLIHLLGHCASSASAPQVVVGGLLLTKPCGGCKTGGSTWRTQHCRTAPQT